MTFDPVAKERELAAESAAWDTSTSYPASDGDIPIIDVGVYFATGSRSDLEAAATALRRAAEDVGFYYLVGHGVPATLIDELFGQVARFHDQPLDAKEEIAMDRPGAIPGTGYLGVGNRKLPTRSMGNENEAVIFKSGNGVSLSDNGWPAEEFVPGFRSTVERYALAVRTLGLRLLPIYAVALDLEPDFFTPGFTDPLCRLRLTHYPPAPAVSGGAGTTGGYGIAPHVDTTFLTLLLQDSPGLTIYSALRDQWIDAPMVDHAFVVNAGELQKQWTNDRFLSTRHFVRPGTTDRYSIPFFFHATADYPMACLPTCQSPDNPAKYPTISYLESQGAVQGE